MSSSFPSGHVTLSVTVYGFLAYLVAQHCATQYHRYIYWVVSILCSCIALSRLYLCVHWLTDVIGGVLLASCFLAWAVIVYRRRVRSPLPVKRLFALLGITLLCLCSLNLMRYYQRDRVNYALVWPHQVLPEQQWWQQQATGVLWYRQNLLNQPQLLNVQWESSLVRIKTFLESRKWQLLPIHAVVSVAKSDVIDHGTEKTAILTKLHHDQKPVVIAVKTDALHHMFVLFLWESNTTLTPSQTPLWTGVVYQNTSHARWPHHAMIADTMEQRAIQTLVSDLLASQYRYQHIVIPCNQLATLTWCNERYTALLIKPQD